MPARRKPTSTRQKKADIQLKRAIKRGDVQVPTSESKRHPAPKARRRGLTGNTIESSTLNPAIQAARQLQSAFITLPPKFLEETKILASTLPLPRPIPPLATVFVDAVDPKDIALSCPRRPKWHFDMSKKEVEHNEEGVFKKWLEETDGTIQKWRNHKESEASGEDLPDQDHSTLEPSTMPRSPTFFERNLEVWRQLYVSNIVTTGRFSRRSTSDGALRKFPRYYLFFLTPAVPFSTFRLPSLLIFRAARSFSC